MYSTSRPADSEPTGFNDKTGQPIYVGDTLQLRLGLNLKHGGPNTYQVIKRGKKYRQLVSGSRDMEIAFVLTRQHCEIAVITDHAH